MKRRETTPPILWICAAACLHYFAAEGGDSVAQVHEDRSALLGLARSIRDRVRATEQTFELTMDPAPADEAQAEPPEAVKPPKEKDKSAKAAPDPSKPQEKPPEPERTPTPEAPKVAAVLEPPPPPPPKDPLTDKRIAVRQHAKPDQAPNDNAAHIADEANHVEEETAARITSHDRDDESPTPGGQHAGADTDPGNSERTRVAESDEHAGEKNRAPGEKGTEFDVQREPALAPVGGATPSPSPANDRQPAPAVAEATPSRELQPGGPGPSSPEISPAATGGWSFNPIRPGAGSGTAREAGPGRDSQRRSPSDTGSPRWLGLGAQAAPGRVNLNLSHAGVIAAVGTDQLRREREADGERRRSEHRGRWMASNFERWRTAIENYTSHVKPGNQTSLNTAAVPFASYLNGMHNRIHPIFADNFLGSLDALPKSHPLNDLKLITRLEIVLTPDGHLLKMGVVKPSGVTAFDIAALDSVQRAQPFGPAPKVIVSPDGRVYLHWEFHRDEVYACSTMNARPFMLTAPPPSAPVEPTPPPLPRPFPRGVPENTRETQHGSLSPAPLRPKSGSSDREQGRRRWPA